MIRPQKLDENSNDWGAVHQFQSLSFNSKKEAFAVVLRMAVSALCVEVRLG